MIVLFLRFSKTVAAMILFGVFLMPSPAAAQLLEMDISPVDNPSGPAIIMSGNAEEAWVVIYSSIPGLKFSSNMDGIVNERGEPEHDRYLLAVRPFTQIFSVHAPGYMVGRFRVQSPQARGQYHYRIQPVDGTTELLPVNFIVDQPGAELFVDDQEVPVGQTVRMEPGPRKIRVEKPGYRTITRDIVINHDNTLFQYALEELFEIPVTIRSDPPGADVYINRVRQDRPTTYQNFFYPGEYLVRLSKSGYRDSVQQIVIDENSSNNFLFEMELSAGSLSLSLQPENARVTINNRDYSGRQQIELSPGIYHVLVDLEGYNSYSERIQIQEGEQRNLSVQLKPKTGILIFSIEDADAFVTLYDDAKREVASWHGINRLADLPVGWYEYTLSLDGQQSPGGRFMISENTTERIIINPGTIDAAETGATARDGSALAGTTSESGGAPEAGDRPGSEGTPGTGTTTHGGAIRSNVATPPADGAYPDISSSGQQRETGVQDETLYTSVEVMPEPVNGLPALYRNIRYPSAARRAGIQGQVIVQFVVDVNGNIRDPLILRGIGGGCDEAAITAIESAKWIPGRQHNQPVPVQMTLPVPFRLN